MGSAGGSSGLHALGVQHHPLGGVDRGVLPGDLGCHRDPGALFQGAGLVILAQEAEKAHILLAAGHGVAAGDEGPLGQTAAGHGQGLEGDGLAGVLLRGVLDVQIPDAVVVVLKLDVVAVQVVGQDVLYLQLFALCVLEYDLRLAVHRADGALPG